MSHLKVPIHIRNVVVVVVLVSAFALSFWGISNTFADDGPEQNVHQDTAEAPDDTENKIPKHLKIKKSANPDDLKLKIQSALEAGKITQEEAEAKLQHLEKMTKKGHMKKSWLNHRKPYVNPDDLKLKIQSALESGKITQEEAEAKLQHLEKMTEKGHMKKSWLNHRKPYVNPDDLKLKIQSALESGKITQEEAEAKLQHLEKMTEKGHMKKSWLNHRKPYVNPDDLKLKTTQ